MREINNLTGEEINQRLRDAEEELANLKFQHATHQLDNTLKVRIARRDVARLKTVMHEIKLGIRQPINAGEDAE